MVIWTDYNNCNGRYIEILSFKKKSGMFRFDNIKSFR